MWHALEKIENSGANSEASVILFNFTKKAALNGWQILSMTISDLREYIHIDRWEDVKKTGMHWKTKN